jgi:hypothetical protein
VTLSGYGPLDEATAAWLAELDEFGDPDYDVTLPSADELPAALVQLAVPHEDIRELVALRPTPADADLWTLLRRSTHSLVRSMGVVNGPPRFPPLPAGMGPLHRYFFVYVYLATLPHLREYHRQRGIPEDVTRLTLIDLGRNLALQRHHHGVGGFSSSYWLNWHFRGTLYQLGRLQFERVSLGGRTGRSLTEAGQPYGPGDPALAVHIPEFYGPLSPSACEASFAWAREFFPRHFPEVPYPLAICHSWLLDEQLAEYLPAGSNIVRFQRRFRQAYPPDVNDEDIQKFVFGRPAPPEQLPRRTTLERAIADHLLAGRHWHIGHGWLAL